MSVPGNQQRTFLELLGRLRPHWRRDPALPARVQALLAAHREFGSRDRRLYRELIYTTLRYLPWVEPLLETDPAAAVGLVAFHAAETKATHAFRAAIAGEPPPAADRTTLLPAWFQAHCPELFFPPELDAQLRRAPLWLRLQTNALGEAAVTAEFATRGWPLRSTAALAGALEVLAEADVTRSDSYQQGLIEVQDLGSQMLLPAAGIAPGGRWLDACAGAGGKTLQLARLLGAGGQIDACDIRPAALAELERRVARARSGAAPAARDEGWAPISVRHALPPPAEYDGVLVDAPCSGSGTWRRAPHLKWVTTAADITRAAATQRRLLEQFSHQVKPGGVLIYATCSLSREENEAVVAHFLGARADFQPQPLAARFGFAERGNGLTIMPSRHNTDGFFVAALRRA
jgi:16S rRNA (cytosine967-C5)-methyltransferase